MKKIEHHGMSNTRLYRIYKAIKQRCTNPKVPSYKNYGGRGIVMCNEWKNSFCAFFYYAISHGYRDDLTTERIDVNGNYEPGNVIFITSQEQAKNTRKAYKIPVGIETKSVSEASKDTGLYPGTIRYRLQRGWDSTKVFDKPRKLSGQLTINGITKTRSAWAKEIGISRRLLGIRVDQGLTGDKLLAPQKRPAYQKKYAGHFSSNVMEEAS